ncbi:uncharacterized protein LOC118356162 [Zalophus californianus]|uniref:Uncharacterized protein LOC118356162 n=1 Tax=Zalophus californianus TaxID=9704 RepID=A0A6P9F0K1_ZALCA|nr:uncharacterized protein LOC118356162 [Zalophus californianus]
MAAGADETTGRRTRGSAPETRGCGPGPGGAPPTPRRGRPRRAGPRPRPLPAGRGLRGWTRVGDHACGPRPLASFLRCLGPAAAACREREPPAPVLRTHTFAKRQ